MCHKFLSLKEEVFGYTKIEIDIINIINTINIINFIDVNTQKTTGVPFSDWTKNALLSDFLNTIR